MKLIGRLFLFNLDFSFSLFKGQTKQNLLTHTHTQAGYKIIQVDIYRRRLFLVD